MKRPWKPIETLPKDERIVLIAFRVRGDEPPELVREGRWHIRQNCVTSTNGFLIYDTAYAWRPMPAPPVQ